MCWRRITQVIESRCRWSMTDLQTTLRVKKYGTRIQYLLKPNGERGSAFNYGFERAQGEIIALLDVDDYWLPQKLSRAVRTFEEHPGVGLVYRQDQALPSGRACTMWPRNSAVRLFREHPLNSPCPVDTLHRKLRRRVWVTYKPNHRLRVELLLPWFLPLPSGPSLQSVPILAVSFQGCSPFLRDSYPIRLTIKR